MKVTCFFSFKLFRHHWCNIMQTPRTTFTRGFWSGVSGLVNFEIGNLESVYLKIAAHSVSEGAMEGIRSGHFEHGFFVGMASAAGGTALNGGMCDRLSAAERSCLASFPIQSVEKRNNTWQIKNINGKILC